ncbi:MAG: hypothetical protein JXD23_04720 [Spirochaetales bacterium]|nr:hypothetical protein [Spirochaetales bacterium]
MNVFVCAFIAFSFVLSFFFPHEGTRWIIIAAISLLVIGLMLIFIHFLERRSGKNQFALAALHRFLSVTIKYVLTACGLAAFFTSIGFFIISGNMNFLLNSGCFIAFTMIIILVELFIRIILPLAGVDQGA